MPFISTVDGPTSMAGKLWLDLDQLLDDFKQKTIDFVFDEAFRVCV